MDVELANARSVLAGESGFVKPLSSSSQQYAASLVVKSGEGVLCGFTVYNSNSAAQFVLLFDAATVPADGVAPVVAVKVAGLATVGVAFTPWGRAFRSGAVLCNSSTAHTKTIGSADCYFDAQYV